MAALALAVQAIPGGAQAQQAGVGGGGAPRDPWRITYGIGADETWSDNINLAPSGSERSDFVTSITPTISATRFGRHLTANFTYQPQFLFYANGTNGNTLRNALAADLKATLVDNFLTFDAGAAITQQNVSPYGTLAANTVNGSSNRAETRTYSLGPTLQSRVNQDISYNAGYRFTQSSSNNSAYATNHSSTAFAGFESSTSFRDIGFGGNYSRQDQQYGGLNEVITEQVGGTLTYVVTPTVHLRGNFGYDRSSYPTTGQADLKGLSYSAGFDWQPSHHSSLNVLFGHRYFGPTANVRLQQASNRYVLSASYTRDQTTSTGSGLTLVADPNYALLDQFYQASIPDPALRAQAVAAALLSLGLPVSQFGTSGFLSNQLFVQKRADISLALLGVINTVVFDIARTQSQSLSAITAGFDVFNQSNRFQTTSYSATWSHKLGPLTSMNGTIQKNRNSAETGFGDTSQRIFTVGVTRTFTRHLSGSVLYRNSMQTSNSGSGGFYGGNYRENAVLGSARLTF